MKNWIVTGPLFLLLAVGCTKNESIPGDHGERSAAQNREFFKSVGAVKPYHANSPYAEQMSNCVYATAPEQSCKVLSLPLLGLSQNELSIDDILDRTLVSQDSLGDSFKQVLMRLNPEVLRMFGAVSAVVISDKVNPSFYFGNSGAIYLSASFLWRSREEQKVLSKTEDPRTKMGQSLRFGFAEDYVIKAKSYASRANRDIQTYDEAAVVMARVLFHELTHANDYFPRSFYKSGDIDQTKTFHEISYGRYLSSQLVSDHELSQVHSPILSRIAQILYFGVEAQSEDNSIMAKDIASEFKNDVATDSYSYSNRLEDLAMLAEEALMLHYYNAARFTVIINLPEANSTQPVGSPYSVVWGEKSRVLEPNIVNRAVFSVENDLGPELGEKIRKNLEHYSPVEIPANASWADIYKL